MIIFDELHKKPEWKNFIKGVFDTKESGTRILVTGSARLEVFDKLGDSLAGRYFRHRLMPFSLAEFRKINETVSLGQLMLRSGFPEPFLADDDLEASRWRQQHVNGLLKSIYAENDYLAEEKELHYLRTKDGLEVDFAVANKGELEYILEAKLSDKNISKSLLNFKEHYGYKAFQIVKNMGKSRIESEVKICVAKEFLEGLYL